MNIDIKSRDMKLEGAVRESIETRVRASLERFGPWISGAEIWFRDLNGPKGGVDTRCVAMVRLVPSGVVRVEHRCVDEFRAVGGAISRLKPLVARTVDRRHEPRRRYQRALSQSMG